jgi:hypothetical protein
MSAPARVEREAIEHEIERHRSELRLALTELRRSTVEHLSPRERLRQQPYAWLGLAASLGFWLAWRRAPRLD